MDMTISAGNVITLAGMVIGVAVAWGVLRTQVAANEKRIRALEDLYSAMSTCQTQLDVKLARIEVDIQWIRQALAPGKKAGE